MNDLYFEIFCELQKEIENEYYNECKNIQQKCFGPLELINNFSNERSIAYFSTFFLSNYFSKKNIENYAINEAAFHTEKTLSNESRIIYETESGSKATDKYKKTLEPDAVISINNKGQSVNLFIEYKINYKSFVFPKLANDYLKYKIYSHNKNIDTKFMYVVFNKNDGLPTLITGKNAHPKIQFIEEAISEDLVDSDSNIFIFDNNIIVEEGKEKSFHDYIGVKEIKVLDKINDSLDELFDKNPEINFYDIENLAENNIYLRFSGCLGNNVSTAMILKNNYRRIHKLYKECMIDINSLIKIVDGYSKDEVNNEEGILKWIKEYFPHFIEDLYKKAGITYNKFAIKGSKRKSRIILLMLEKYSKDNGFDFGPIKFDDNEEQDGLNKLRSTFFYDQQYTEAEYKIKFDAFVKSILYFIINLYKVMYKYKDENSKIDYDDWNFNNEYKNYLIKESVINSVKQIKHLIGKSKNSSIDWNLDVDEFAKKILCEILKCKFDE